MKPADSIQDLQYFGEFGGINPSISDSSTYTFLSAKTMFDTFEGNADGCYLYSRHSSPSNLYLGEALAAMEGTETSNVSASGMGAIGHGTDIAGSLRYPAYACGIHGLRPSLGRVPMINYTTPDRHIGGQIMAVSGPLARSIEDLEIGLKVMSRENFDDPWWAPIPFSFKKPQRKIALITEIEGLKVDPIIKNELEMVAKHLEEAGWIIEQPRAPNFQEAAKFQATLWLGEFRRTGGEAIKKENDPDANFIFEQMSRRCPDTSLESFMDALQNRARISRNWNKFFDEYPLILCPVTGDLPFPDLKDLESQDSFDLVFDSMLPQIAPPYLGLPGLSFATNKTPSNIPLGVQFISRKYREDILLNVGYDLEKFFPKILPVFPN